MSAKSGALLADDAPIMEMEGLQTLIGSSQERGFVTVEEIAEVFDEVDVSKEQVVELHSYLEEQGITITRSKKAKGKEAKGVEALAALADKKSGQPKNGAIDLTVEPSLDSLRLYLRSIGRVDLLTA